MEDTPKGTKQPVDLEREQLIQEMLRDAQKVNLGGELEKNPIIHKGNETQPPMVLHEITSAGYVKVYSTEDGAEAYTLYYRLPQILRQRLPNGKYRWTVADPGIRPFKGQVKCMLHPDDPNRKHYALLGFRECNKHNLTSLHQLNLHMQRRHPQEWATIEEERKEKERQEDRALQRALLEMQATNLKTIQGNEQVLEESSDEPYGFLCETCGKTFAYAKSYRKHVKNCK